MIKLGSLFDGSGGFPLAGAMCGFVPTWASEVEPYPIAVTKNRLPNMRHLGDISKINGANIEPVDIITFGFPCQDVSVAGKRAGLKHEDNGDDETTRSGLFWEAVRIIEEMRGATNGEYPRFAVFENVPGLFSAEKGEAFRTVCEGLIKIIEPTAVMPEVPKKGWAYADCYIGNGWSYAYRTFDAQYIRTAQRRRRVYAVLDLAGERAGEILFKRESLRGYPPQSRETWQGITADVEGSVGADDRERAVCYGIGSYDSNAMKSSNPHSGIYEADTSRTLDPNGENPACHQGGIAIVENAPYVHKTHNRCLSFHLTQDPITSEKCTPCISSGNPISGQAPVGVVVGYDGYNGDITDDKSSTLGVNCGMSTGRNGVITLEPGIAAREGGHIYEGVSGTLRANAGDNQMAVAYSIENHPNDSRVKIDDEGKVQALTSRMGTGGGNVPRVMEEHPIAIDRAFFNQGKNALYEPQTYEDGTNPTIVAKGPSAVCYKKPPHYIVRRLTPTECARLQGFPDTWGHIEPKSDFTDEEYKFWLEVRNTHAAINDKAVKDYTKKQMLTWYNKLWTDSAEYKLWGNGLALPCALYVMEGIADAVKREKKNAKTEI